MDELGYGDALADVFLRSENRETMEKARMLIVLYFDNQNMRQYNVQ